MGLGIATPLACLFSSNMAVPERGSVGRLLVFPVNGYVNRLQALASSWVLADRLGADVAACWVPFENAPGPPTDIFTASFCRRFFISQDSASDLVGVSLEEIPRYVTHNTRLGWISLRGHDKGEQALMPELLAKIGQQAPVPLLVVVAGGTFHVVVTGPESEEAGRQFLAAKREFYRQLPLHDEIETAVRAELETDSSPYIGLHLRYTDRAHEAPFAYSIRRALRDASSASGIRRVFIASDTPNPRERWHDEVRRMGLEPWSVDHATWDRRARRSAHPALVDWRLLGNAERLVHFMESTFAVEAVVAAGAWEKSIALGRHRLRSAMVRTQGYVHAALRRLRASPLKG